MRVLPARKRASQEPDKLTLEIDESSKKDGIVVRRGVIDKERALLLKNKGSHHSPFHFSLKIGTEGFIFDGLMDISRKRGDKKLMDVVWYIGPLELSPKLRARETEFRELLSGIMKFYGFLGARHKTGTVNVCFIETSLRKTWPQVNPLREAEMGHAWAQRSVGRYHRGKDENEAAKWFLKAALQEDKDSQILLGHCYLNGKGVRQDDAEAFFWFSASEPPASPSWTAFLEDIKKKLSPDEIERIQKRLDEWKSKRPR